MPGQTGKNTFMQQMSDDLLVFASCTRNPLRNRVIVLLSAKAGLRAGEIANLTWDMVVGPTGQISGMHRAARPRSQERQRPCDPYASGSPRRARRLAPGCSSLGPCRHL